MPPKKTGSAAPKKAAGHASYRDMIKDAIMSLKERNGSSRQSIKKYVKSNNNLSYASPAVFDSQFNKAIKAGVDRGDFTQPKGPSGPLKLAKKEKEAAKPAPKKAAPAKAAAPKKAAATTTTKKKTEKKTEKPAAKSTTKKATTAAPKKKAAAKPKANTAKPRKTPASAPAVVEQPKVLSTTKSGRVTKTTANPEKPAPKKRATTKKT